MQSNSIELFRKNRREALEYIQSKTDMRPNYMLILGTGLGQLADEMTIETVISYDEIPHFPISTVESHAGKLLFGTLGDKEIVAMQGRFHYYEGYNMNQIVFPVRVLKANGAHTLIVSNACGGMNPNFKKGDIMLINDHINLLGDNPLMGPNDDELGPRFPDMSDPYTESLRETAQNVALAGAVPMHQGVYAAVSGPMLETRAEYRYLRLIGGDVVGMSTVPEVIAAVHMQMDVLGISVITDECFPEALEPVNLEDILQAAAMAEPKMTKVIIGVLEKPYSYRGKHHQHDRNTAGCSNQDHQQFLAGCIAFGFIVLRQGPKTCLLHCGIDVRRRNHLLIKIDLSKVAGQIDADGMNARQGLQFLFDRCDTRCAAHTTNGKTESLLVFFCNNRFMSLHEISSSKSVRCSL